MSKNEETKAAQEVKQIEVDVVKSELEKCKRAVEKIDTLTKEESRK